MTTSDSQKTDTSNSKVTNIETAKVRRAKQRIELEAILLEIDSLDPHDISMTPVEALELSEIFDRCARLPTAYDGEVAKRCVDHFGLHISEIGSFKRTIQQLRASLGFAGKKEKIRTAEREEFFELFEKSLGPLERDIFSGDLMRKSDEGFWIPAVNHIDIAKSDAAELRREGVSYPFSEFMPHFLKYEQSKPRKLIMDFVEWDGQDRLAAIAKCLVLDGSQEGFDSETVEDMLKAWMAGVLMRVDNHRYQNPCLIFYGAQGKGKDWLIETMTDGFGQWVKHLGLTNNKKDDFVQLSRALIFKVPEFDKTAKMDSATLKDMIYRPDTCLREAYGRREVDKLCRCSFIASTNDDDIYKDPSGHRRYWPINLADIRWEYPTAPEDRRQIAAQAKVLAAQRYKLAEKTQLLIREYVDGRTPERIEVELAEHWDELVKAYLEGESCGTWKAEQIRSRGWIGVSEARDAGIIDRILKAHRITERYFFGKLGLIRRRIRSSTMKGYGLGPSVIGHGSSHGSGQENDVIF